MLDLYLVECVEGLLALPAVPGHNHVAHYSHHPQNRDHNHQQHHVSGTDNCHFSQLLLSFLTVR